MDFNDRFDMDPSWSETGDRYILKLFRDYVFHQVYEDGSPALDFGHVVDSLNKVPLTPPSHTHANDHSVINNNINII